VLKEELIFILSGKTTSFGRGQSELALPEGNKSIGGVGVVEY
jgi:hypothetical protein